MRVRHGLVGMFMFVAFCQVKPNPKSHQTPGHKKLEGDGLSKNQYSRDCAQERCGREIRAGARGPEMPKRDNEQREAYAVAKKTDEAGQQDIKRLRQRSSGRKSKRDSDGPGGQSLELDNLQRIGQRNFPG